MISPWTIGPRQITGESSVTKKPIDMSFMPWPISGMIFSIRRRVRAAVDAREQRERGAVDVGVEEADLRALIAQR